MKFDWFWRLKAVELAAHEQIDIIGEIDLKKVFVRAKQIYNKGYEEDIDKWQTFWEGKEESKPIKKKTTKKKPTKKKASEGMKICPDCGEEVPEGWAKHGYKSDGEKCGYKFE